MITYLLVNRRMAMTNTNGKSGNSLFSEIALVFKSEEVDRWIIFQHLASVLMLIGIIVSITSNSWFVVSIDGTDFFGDSVDSKINYGLTSVESYDEYMIEGVVIETSVVIPFSECDGWGSGGLFDDDVAADSGLQCDTMSIFGKVMILGYLGTITLLIGLILSSLYVGYKNPDGEFWVDKYHNYRAILTKASSLIPLTIILIYAFIGLGHDIDTLDSATSLGDINGAGLGITWWLMFLLTVTYSSLVFRTELKQFIPKIIELFSRSGKND